MTRPRAEMEALACPLHTSRRNSVAMESSTTHLRCTFVAEPACRSGRVGSRVGDHHADLHLTIATIHRRPPCDVTADNATRPAQVLPAASARRMDVATET